MKILYLYFIVITVTAPELRELEYNCSWQDKVKVFLTEIMQKKKYQITSKTAYSVVKMNVVARESNTV